MSEPRALPTIRNQIAAHLAEIDAGRETEQEAVAFIAQYLAALPALRSNREEAVTREDPTHHDGRPDTPEESRRISEALGEHRRRAVVIDRNTPEYAAIVAILDDGEMAMQRPDSQETADLICAAHAATPPGDREDGLDVDALAEAVRAAWIDGHRDGEAWGDRAEAIAAIYGRLIATTSQEAAVTTAEAAAGEEGV